MTDVDTAACREVLARVYRAWAEGDADAFAACFTPDASSILPGDVRTGRDTIRSRMSAAFAGRLKGSSVVDEVRGVHLLGHDAAVLVSRSGVLLHGEREVPADRWVMATWVLTRRPDGWLVAAYHNCPAAA